MAVRADNGPLPPGLVTDRHGVHTGRRARGDCSGAIPSIIVLFCELTLEGCTHGETYRASSPRLGQWLQHWFYGHTSPRPSLIGRRLP